MAPLTKDSVDVAGPASEVSTRPVAPAQKPSTPAAGQLRADARSVEIPVKVHGSKVSAAPVGAAPRTEPFEEQTSTMIVFPQGGVIRMSTSVAIGQMLVVTNQKTRQDAICRVIKVRTFTNMQGYVEVEFTHKQDGYWGVQFGANAPATPAASTATPVPVAAPAAPVIAQVAPPAPQVTAPQPVAAAPVKPVQEIPVAPAVAPQISQPQVAATIPAPPVAPKPEAVAPPPAAPQAVTPIQSAQVTPLPPPTFVPPPPPAPPVTVAVAPPPAPVKASVPPPPGVPPKQESPFVWIGTQEEVQPAASATETVKPSLDLNRLSTPTRAAAPVESKLTELPKIELPTIESLTAPAITEDIADLSGTALPSSTSAATELTMSELRGDAAVASPEAAASLTAPESEKSISEEKPAESSRAVFGSLSGGASFGARAASASTESSAFGSRLDGSLGSTEEATGKPRSSNWGLVAVAVVVVLAVVIGGVMYFRSQSNAGTANQPTPQSQQVAAEQNALQNSAIQQTLSGPVATVVPSGAPAVTVSAAAATPSTPKPSSPAKQAVDKIAAMFQGSTVEHPVAPQRTDSAATDAAPALDAGSPADGASGNALPGVISSATMAAPAAPEIRPEGPIVKGGEVAEPKLIYRALPVYPQNAKQAGITGEVVIKTTIDQKGAVVDMHVVSGPLMLRQAALDALRRWKYEPSKLDGQPISVQMLVTIKFSR